MPIVNNVKFETKPGEQQIFHTPNPEFNYNMYFASSVDPLHYLYHYLMQWIHWYEHSMGKIHI